MNLLEIIILAVVLLLAAAGWRKGFVKKLASVVSLVLSIVLVSIFLPYITDFLKDNTPVYDAVVKQCNQVLEQQVRDRVKSGSTGNSQVDQYRNMGRDEIKALMEQNGYDSTVVDMMTDQQIEEYKEQYIQQYMDQYLGGSQQSQSSRQLSRIDQTELIESLPLPESLKDMMLDYNNDEGYKSLGVSNFQDYVINYIATVILNLLAFVVSVIVVNILLRIILAALNIISRIPVIRFVNHLLGLALGLVEAVFALWVFFMILSMISGTELGLTLLNMVQKSQYLSILYDSNLFMDIVLRAASVFV